MTYSVGSQGFSLSSQLAVVRAADGGAAKPTRSHEANRAAVAACPSAGHAEAVLDQPAVRVRVGRAMGGSTPSVPLGEARQ